MYTYLCAHVCVRTSLLLHECVCVSVCMCLCVCLFVSNNQWFKLSTNFREFIFCWKNQGKLQSLNKKQVGPLEYIDLRSAPSFVTSLICHPFPCLSYTLCMNITVTKIKAFRISKANLYFSNCTIDCAIDFTCVCAFFV